MGLYRCANRECGSSAIYYRSRGNDYICRSCGNVFSRGDLDEARAQKMKENIDTQNKKAGRGQSKGKR